MEKGKNSKIDVNELIFRYKWWIGGFLLVAIALSGGYLVWREGKVNNEVRIMNNGSDEEKIEQLEARIKEAEGKISQLQSQATSAQTAPAASSTSGAVAGTSTSSSSKSSVPTGKINLNTATAAELDTLPGIGAAYAQRILDYRQSSGGFKDITELKNIKGIGDKTFEKLKEMVTI